jgi:hypothetical protein
MSHLLVACTASALNTACDSLTCGLGGFHRPGTTRAANTETDGHGGDTQVEQTSATHSVQLQRNHETKLTHTY